MGSVRICVGSEWLLDGRAFRIVRQLSPHEFVVLDINFHQETTLSLADILAEYNSGRLTFANTESKKSRTRPRRPLVLKDLSDSDRLAVEERWQAIEPLTKLGRAPTPAEYQARSVLLTKQGIRRSARSLRRYWQAWSRAGGERLALIPKNSRCGHRGTVRRNSFLGRNPRLKQLVNEAIQNVYLSMARRPIAAVARRVFDDLQRHNAQVSHQQALPIPRPAALERAISRRIAQLDPWEVDRARWGRRIADRKHQPTRRQKLATRILQRVEIDHTPLKIVVGSDAGPIGQPWLTVLIDYYSRMIVGFCLGFEPPSYAVIMEALRQAILPKTQLQDRYPKLQNPWPCFGIPEKIVCDRGSDLTSKDLEDAAFQLGIELDFAPPRTPHFKGTVESFFDTLNDLLLASLPGRTFRSWERRADYQPDDGPLMPYETLLEIVHLHLVDVYSQSQHPTAGKTRLEVWQESAAEFPPCLPASPDDLVVLLAKRVERNLSARGIEVGGMFYLSDELMALRAELAANNLSSDHLQVRYNPWDLGKIWVLNPIDKRYLPAEAVDSALCGLTEYQWRVIKRAVRERFDKPEHLLSLAASRNAIRDVVEKALTKPSRKRRQRAARFLQKLPDQTASETGDAAEPLTRVSEPPNERESQGPFPVLAEDLPTEIPADIDPTSLDVDDWDVSCG